MNKYLLITAASLLISQFASADITCSIRKQSERYGANKPILNCIGAIRKQEVDQIDYSDSTGVQYGYMDGTDNDGIVRSVSFTVQHANGVSDTILVKGPLAMTEVSRALKGGQAGLKAFINDPNHPKLFNKGFTDGLIELSQISATGIRLLDQNGREKDVVGCVVAKNQDAMKMRTIQVPTPGCASGTTTLCLARLDCSVYFERRNAAGQYDQDSSITQSDYGQWAVCHSEVVNGVTGCPSYNDCTSEYLSRRAIKTESPSPLVTARAFPLPDNIKAQAESDFKKPIAVAKIAHDPDSLRIYSMDYLELIGCQPTSAPKLCMGEGMVGIKFADNTTKSLQGQGDFCGASEDGHSCPDANVCAVDTSLVSSLATPPSLDALKAAEPPLPSGMRSRCGGNTPEGARSRCLGISAN